jgi:hypothetical protein
LNKNLWTVIHKQQEREVDRGKAGKVPFWRKQGNAAKQGARLRGLRARVSDEDVSQMSYVANGNEG